MSVAKQLAAALNGIMQFDGIHPDWRNKAHDALDAYYQSEEFKREAFEEKLRGALTTATALADTIAELRMVQHLSDADLILLRSANELIAEGADTLNTIIEGP